MVLLRFVKTVRTHWKKSIFFTAVGLYGVKYAKDRYRDALFREEFFRQAQKYGQQPLKLGESPRKVTVFLNPAAQKGKAKKLFDKNVAPLLYLAGMEVTVIKTEYEGQAKKYMDVIDNTDAIIIAGGNGTLSEVVTGLLRRTDHERFKNVPIGVIPLGYSNTLAHSLVEKGESAVKWLIDLGMAIVLSTTKCIDVLQIQGEEGKTVYAVNGLDWGPYRDAEERKSKYWYTGGLKHRWTYLMSTFTDWPPNVHAEMTYQYPCEGCSRCYVPPPVVKWKWWHVFVPPKRDAPQKDYSTVNNPECGVVHNKDLNTIELHVETANVQKSEMAEGMKVTMGPSDISKTDFIKEGWNRINSPRNDEGTESLDVAKFTLKPELKEEKSSWFSIDNEDFEVMPVEVTVLKNKLKVFSPISLEPAS